MIGKRGDLRLFIHDPTENGNEARRHGGITDSMAVLSISFED
jgi:hypothetical protein